MTAKSLFFQNNHEQQNHLNRRMHNSVWYVMFGSHSWCFPHPQIFLTYGIAAHHST